MNTTGADLRERLRRRLHALGFDVVRFAAIGAPVDGGLAAWLAAGHQAGMAWMERSSAKRIDPALVLPGARTMIVLGVNYWRPDFPPAAGGVWARYSLHADYHDTVGAALERARTALQEEGGAPDDCRGFVDAGPVLERAWGVAAGLGFAGKNANLISREFGNWMLLAALLSRAALPPDEPLAAQLGRPSGPAAGLLCGRCTRCLEACPTAAFPAPGVVDARRCISYHTIENRGVVPRALRPAFGARLFGCDVCLEACPWNRFARAAREELLERRDDLAQLRLLEVLRLSPERFRSLFRGTAVWRTRLAGLQRNACIAAGNVWRAGGPEAGVDVPPGFAPPGDAGDAVAELLRLTGDPSPVVRAHAVGAVRRILAATEAAAALAPARAAETDPAVVAEFPAGA